MSDLIRQQFEQMKAANAKMRGGFTVIEAVVVVFILSLCALLFYGAIHASDNEQSLAAFNPEYATALAQQKIAKELAEQNRLMREELLRRRNDPIEK